jgi:hypothetical protein
MTTTEVCFDIENESNNTLAIKIKNDIIDKLLTCSTKEEAKQVLNEVITENYNSLDISKVRTGDASIAITNEIGPVLDSFVVCSLEESINDPNLSSTQIQVGELLKNAIDLVCNPPSFAVPQPFPIIDISDDFLKQLLLALTKVAVKILISLLKKLLQLIIDVCSSGLSNENLFGGANLADVLAQSFAGSIQEATTYINDVFGAFGLDPNGVPATSIVQTGEPCDEETTEPTSAKTTSDFLDDLSSVLTPTEICSLFEGTVSDQTYQIIEELLQFDYPSIKSVFNSRIKIKQLFLLLGKKVDPNICKAISDNAQRISSVPDLCLSDDAVAVRKSFLQQRDLSDEEIEELLDKERERQKANLEKVAEIIAKIKNDPNKLLGDESPNIFCRGGQSGIISIDQMPSLKESINRSTDYIFNLFAKTNINETNYFASSLLKQEKTLNEDDPTIPKFTNLTIQDKSGNIQLIPNTLNPTFVQKTSIGSFELCDNQGNTDIDSLKSYYSGGAIDTIDEDGNLDIQAILSVTSKKQARKLGSGDNVYIANYTSKQVLTPDLFNSKYGIINSGSAIDSTFPITKFLGDLITTDISNMSININIPTKFSVFGEQTTVPDFTTIESTDNIIIYIDGKE